MDFVNVYGTAKVDGLPLLVGKVVYILASLILLALEGGINCDYGPFVRLTDQLYFLTYWPVSRSMQEYVKMPICL